MIEQQQLFCSAAKAAYFSAKEIEQKKHVLFNRGKRKELDREALKLFSCHK